MLIVRKVQYQDVLYLKHLASKDAIKISPSYEYFAGFINGRIVGFCALSVGRGRVTLRSDYVLPQFRGQGYYRAMDTIRMKYAQTLGKRIIEINCKPSSLPLHLKTGGVVEKRFKGWVRLIYTVNS